MRFKIALGIAVSLACLAAVFGTVDLAEFGRAFTRVDYRWSIPTVVLILSIIVLRAIRWRILLAPVKTIGLVPLSSATAIGFMANNLLPLRMGEIARAWVLARRVGIPTSTAIASLVLERAFDLFSILAGLALVLLVEPPAGGDGGALMKAAGAGALGMLVIALGALIAIERHPALLARFGALAHRFLPVGIRGRLDNLLDSFVEGLKVLRSVGRLVAVLVLSLFIWVVYTAAVWSLLTACALELPPLAPVTIMVIISLGVLAPSTPGFVGTFHAAAVGALMLYGVPEGDSRVFAVLYHALNFIPVVAVGLLFLWREGLTLSSLRNRPDGR